MSAKTAGKRIRSSLLHVYLHDREHDLLREVAAESGSSTSAWVRAQVIASARKLKRTIARERVDDIAAE